MPNPNILILDDDEHFREGLKQALQRQGFTVMASAPTRSVMRSLVRSTPPELIMDVFLGEWSIQKWLGWLKTQGMAMDTCRIWLVSGAETAPTNELNREYRCVQTTWFGKPVDVQVLLGQLRSRPDRPQAIDRRNKDLDGLPVPLRVIDASGRIVFTNAHWKAAANRPDPSSHNPESEYWGPLPGDPETFGRYRLRSFPLPKSLSLVVPDDEQPDPSPLQAQIVETLPGAQPETLDKLFDQAFQTLKDAGFSRARLYRVIPVPGCQGMSELWKALGPGYESLKLPIEHALYGECAKRLEESRQTTKPEPDKLIYTIRYRDDALEQEDPGLKFWNELVVSEVQESWVDIPILRKTPERDYRSIGLLVLDRIGTSGVLDGVPEQVNEDQVKKIEQTLRQTFNQLIRIIKREEKVNELRVAQHSNRWDSYLGQSATDRRHIENILLKLAKRLTRADTGILAVREGGTDELVVHAARGIPAAMAKELRFPLRAERFLAVRSWNTGQAQYLPDVQNIPIDERVTPDDCIDICPKYGNEFYQFLEQKRRSVVALPMHYGTRVIGVITLKSERPYHFTGPRVQVLQALLNRARWYMHLALEERQKLWGFSVMHDVRSRIQVVNQGIRALERSTEPASPFYRQALQRAKRSGLSLADLSEGFLDLLAAGVQRPTAQASDVSPGEVIDEFLALYQEEVEWQKQTIRRSPDDTKDLLWQVTLSGQGRALARVVRNLLQNALRYGGMNAEIRIQAHHEDDSWCLEVWNPGHMTEDEDRLKFVAFEKPAGVKRDGSHVGLAASLILTEASGGELDLENITDPQGIDWVRARLRWPLKRREESGP